MDERRKHRRFSIRIPASVVHASGECTGSMLNISRDGAFFTADVPVSPDAPAYVRFDLPEGMAEAVGIVVRVSDFGGTPCIGLHFRTGNDAYVDLIDRLEQLSEAERPYVVKTAQNVVLRVGSE